MKTRTIMNVKQARERDGVKLIIFLMIKQF